MGRPARIDRPAVLAAALSIADETGLQALTMAGVARRLDVTPMALYRHVANKADLLDGMVELLLTEFEPPPTDAWADRLRCLAEAIRASARRHPSVFPLLLQRPATTPGARQARSAVYAALRDAGVDDDRVAQTERLISTAVLGFAASEAGGRFGHHSRSQLDADFERLQAMLALFIESESSTPGSEGKTSPGPMGAAPHSRR